MGNTINILCFDCGSMFSVPFGTVNMTKQCPKCMDK